MSPIVAGGSRVVRGSAASRGLVPAWVVALIALLAQARAVGQQPEAAAGWVGQRVVIAVPEAVPLMDGANVLEKDADFTIRFWRVTRAEAGWLHIQAENSARAGWVQARQVVPFDRAIDHFTRSIQLSPSAWAYQKRATIWREKGEHDIAIADLNEAIRQDPGAANYWNSRGSAWDDKKEYDKAIADYNEAIRLDPGYATAYNNRGNAWSHKKEYDKAIADYNEAIRLDPGYAAVYNNRGIAWSAKKEYDKAIADTNEAIRLDPGYAAAYNNRGNAWSYKKEHDKAIADYSEAIRLDPGYANAYICRGNAWTNKEEYDKAIADTTKAIRLDPGSMVAYSFRGIAWRKKKRYDKAIADYSETIRLDPGDPYGHNSLAWILATCPEDARRDGKRAVEIGTKACELSGWKDASYIDTLAAAHAEAGDFAKAIEMQEKANGLYTDAEARKEGEEHLALYREGKPYREVD